MKNNTSYIWYNKEDVKIKQKGSLALVNTTINHNNKLKALNNRCVWPSYMSTETYANTPSKKNWKI